MIISQNLTLLSSSLAERLICCRISSVSIASHKRCRGQKDVDGKNLGFEILHWVSLNGRVKCNVPQTRFGISSTHKKSGSRKISQTTQRA